jgi:hypothetical protein
MLPSPFFLLWLHGLIKSSVKSSPITALDKSLGLQEVEAPRISTQSAHEGGKVSHMHWLPLPPRIYHWFSFLLEAESAPGPQCGRKDEVNEK